MPAVELLGGRVVGVGEQRDSPAPSHVSELNGGMQESRSCPATPRIRSDNHVLEYCHSPAQRCGWHKKQADHTDYARPVPQHQYQSSFRSAQDRQQPGRLPLSVWAELGLLNEQKPESFAQDG